MSNPHPFEPGAAPAQAAGGASAPTAELGRTLALLGFASGIVGILLRAIGGIVYAALVTRGYQSVQLAASLQSVLLIIGCVFALLALVLGIMALLRYGSARGLAAASATIGAVILFEALIIGVQSLIYLMS